ncbi:MAG: heme NO-binding domain-containing protein [Candidatus Omnitrophica bacterium]|nr:heme NO-binding domain-containing protein [Candidatus Omnitrophota bacterium]
MKGVIPKCLGELVVSKFGKDRWKKILSESGLSENTLFMAVQDIDDGAVIKVIENTCKILNITLIQAADAFGEYWVCEFAPKLYSGYYKNKTTTKDFLAAMDEVHQKTTINIPGAHPPRFEYEWTSEDTLIMHYKSSRGLIDFLVGLVKGVVKYFKENHKVTKLSDTKVQIVFK